MVDNKIKWCFKIKDGAKIVDPSREISESFIDLAKQTLKSAELVLENHDLIWSSSMIYYSTYYALSAFLGKVGIKCENHKCSLEIAGLLLGDAVDLKEIEKYRKLRLDAQYYAKTKTYEELKSALNKAKLIVLEFDQLLLNLSEAELKRYRELAIKNSK